MYRIRARKLKELGRIVEAIGVYSEAIDKFPTHSLFHVNRSFLYLSQGMHYSLSSWFSICPSPSLSSFMSLPPLSLLILFYFLFFFKFESHDFLGYADEALEDAVWLIKNMPHSHIVSTLIKFNQCLISG